MPLEKKPAKISNRRAYEQKLINNINNGMPGMGITVGEILRQRGITENMVSNTNRVGKPNKNKGKKK